MFVGEPDTDEYPGLLGSKVTPNTVLTKVHIPYGTVRGQ